MLRQPYMMSSDTIIFMKTQEQTRTLQDGTMLIIRSIMPQDAEETVRLVKRMYGQCVFLFRTPEEFTMTAEDEQAFISAALEDPRSLFLGAFVDGHVIGTCALGPVGGGSKSAHRCTLSISIDRQWQSKGIGSAMMESVIAMAPAMGYAQIELEVASRNTQAVWLYMKYGFRRCGTIPHALRLKDGSALDLDMMVLELPPQG